MDDFLYKMFFDRDFFERKKYPDRDGKSDGEKNKTKKRMRGERGPDRRPRHHRPWLIEERVHLRILELLREGRGQRWIARMLGVGVQTVQRRAEVLRREGERDEDDGDGECREELIEFRKVRGGEVCERHGPITVWPCVQCAAEAERAKRGSCGGMN